MSFWKRVVCIALLAALLPLSLVLTGFAMPECYGDSYYGELSQMYRRLRTVEGKKIVIVGGSNVAFGVDTELLETLLRQCGYDYSVCSFGLYAAVGTGVMLTLSEDWLEEGDIVVLAIEPAEETLSGYFGATAFWKCAESLPELLLALDSGQRAAIAGNFLEYLQQRLEIVRSGVYPQAQGVYGKASFNDRCDMVYDRPGNTMALGYDTGNPIDLAGAQLQPELRERIEAYWERAKNRGADVVMSFSPMNRGALVDASEQTVYEYFLRCQQDVSCPVISDPHDYILDSGWFYDTNFHLNTAGAQIRTAQLAEDLLSYLGCYQALRFQKPDMPPPAVEEAGEGANQDLFLYENVEGGGWLVSGLTEAGKRESSLRLPDAYEGKAVVGFTADAFAGNTAVTELTFPDSIESIPDGAFSGCENLTRLVLLHTKTPPAIGDAPFAGADGLRIYVPSGAYALYRDGAGCGINPWEAYLDRIVGY